MAKKTKLSQMTDRASSKTVKPVPVKIVADTVNAVPKSSVDHERKWKAEDALRTCKEYAKIKNDKQLMNDVKKLAKEEIKKLEGVAKKY